MSNWVLITLWVCDIPTDSEDASECMKDHMFELRRKIWRHDWSSQLYTQLKQLLLWTKAWKKIRLQWDSNPWPLRYQCSALPTELSRQLGAGHVVKCIVGSKDAQRNKSSDFCVITCYTTVNDRSKEISNGFPWLRFV